MSISMLDYYKRETPLRNTGRLYREDIKAVMQLRADQWQKLFDLVWQRKREYWEAKVLDIYEARRKLLPDLGKAVTQNDIFEMIELQDYEPDPTTQWPSMKEMLRKAKTGDLPLPEFLQRSFHILVQEKAY